MTIKEAFALFKEEYGEALSVGKSRLRQSKLI
jgi:hypothetical protein